MTINFLKAIERDKTYHFLNKFLNLGSYVHKIDYYSQISLKKIIRMFFEDMIKQSKEKIFFTIIVFI